MSKFLTFILLAVLVHSLDAQELKFDSTMTTEIELIKKIKPKNDYKNWQIVTSYDSIIYITGKRFTIPKDSKSGYLTLTTKQSHTFSSSSSCYIIVQENEKFKEIRNEKSLIEFIGEIDNIHEAILILYLNGFYYDYSHPSSYSKLNNGYKFKTTKFHYCPNKSEEKVITTDKNGITEIKSNGFYKVTDDCYTIE
ncbi:hypothetical protein [Winogradskyella helgolandensis]|uniref:hypothetical protein n=1 Tax=Winogradskyella helgolandensis TaxID=2697010 RepID=UPI0015C95D38|nr:hypothetical protein [Winogradskyella helgolandensis]